MNTVPSPTKETDEKKRRRDLLPLFLLLLFLLLATSCIVGFLLGRSTEPGRFGALIDTIVLSPEQADPAPPASPAASEGPAAGHTEGRIDLIGAVRYTDGTPFTQGSVRLRSEPRYSQVDEQGRFRFDEVETGTHELTVLDRLGNELARRTIEVERDAGETAYMEYEQEVCILHIKLLTIEVDVELTVDKDPGGPLELKLVGTREKETVPAFSPSGPPAAETQGQRPGEPSPIPTAAPGETPGVTETAAPGAEPTAEPASEPTVEPTAGPTAAPTAAPAMPSATPTAKPTATPKPSQKPSSDDKDDDHGGGGGGAVAPPAPTPDTVGETEVYHGDSGLTWTQQAEIDLFRPLDGSAERRIAPGSKGYYLFKLKNGRSGKVKFTLAIREGNFHVPLQYRITDGATRAELSGWRTASVETETVSDALELEGGTEGCYRIEWKWPFDGNDGVDTTLGQQGGTYTLQLTIRAEDVV